MEEIKEQETQEAVEEVKEIVEEKTEEVMKEEIKEAFKEIPKEEVKEVNVDELVKSYEEELNTIKFFTDQTRFNATMYQGMQLILQKLTAMEENLNESKK